MERDGRLVAPFGEAVEAGQLRPVVQRGDEGGEEFREHRRRGDKPAQGNALGH